jgi:hypothetical protein
MECPCGREYTVYDLFPRSNRLYIYLCSGCMKGFLAHHFDLNLDIFNLKDVYARKFRGIIFISGLELDPRVFEFEVDADPRKEVIIVADEKNALGELVENGEKYLFASYSCKGKRRLNDLLDKSRIDGGSVAERLATAWRNSE